MSDYDQLIDAVVTAARRPRACAAIASRPARWTEAEEQFYLDHLADLTLEEIAAALGRSPEAVKIHRFRAGLPSHRRTPGYLTTHQVAVILGVDGHAPPVWVDTGVLPGERVPYTSGEPMRRVSLLAFKLWLVRPTSWIYFDAARITQPHLRRLVELAQAKWGDAWWTTRQAADYHQCDPKDIERQIRLGKLAGLQSHSKGGRNPGQRWAYWYVRRSDVQRLVLYRGKGAGRHQPKWTARADAFMLRAARAGITYAAIARMMKRGDVKSIGYRLKQLGYLRTPDWTRGRRRGQRD